MNQTDPDAATGRPALFTPLRLNGAVLPNRIVLAPMCQYQAIEGLPNEWHQAHHGRYATAGLGAAIAEATGISRDGRISPGCTGIWSDDHVAAWKPITAMYRRQGVPSFLQINHAGAKASTARPWDGAGPLEPGGTEPPWQTVSASAVPARPGWHVPRELTQAEIAGITRDFAAAARRALAAGFDGVEIHGAHGYLLHTFMSNWSNRRQDGYGGTLEGRMRLPVEVARAIRQAIPREVPVIYRASCTDGAGGDLTLEDSVALAHELKRVGVDMLHASSGGIPAGLRQDQQAAPPGPGFQVPLAARIREMTGLPTMAVGLITEPDLANRVIAEGQADAVALGRGLLREPAWPLRAAEALGLEDPASILPRHYAFYLGRAA